MGGVGQEQLEALLEQVSDRLPVAARGLHRGGCDSRAFVNETAWLLLTSKGGVAASGLLRRGAVGNMCRLLGLTAAVAIALSACAGPSATASPSASPAPMTAQPAVSVANGTTVPVAIAVNGTVVGTVPAGSTEDPIPAALPARLWTVEARSPSGRVLATLTVSATDYVSNSSGKAVREDLACGRLDLWSGPPLLGPMFSPDPSKPCD
jgi:hypothetical protein